MGRGYHLHLQRAHLDTELQQCLPEGAPAGFLAWASQGEGARPGTHQRELRRAEGPPLCRRATLG